MRAVMLVLYVAALSAPSAEARAQIIYGNPVAVDGDTLDFGGERVRLFGIDAPESAQTCTRKGVAWPCGQDAAALLQALVTNSNVSCEQRDRDRYGRVVAVCSARRQDLSETLARAGYAVALDQFSTDYVAAVESARASRLGIWSGEFQAPADFRASDPRHIAERAEYERNLQRQRGQAPERTGPSGSAQRRTYFRDCKQAWAAGAAPLKRGQPGYRVEMDGDGDGVACEPYRRK